MTSRIFPLYNDNIDHIDLNTICGYSICSKAENYMFVQDDLELSSEDYEYLNDIEREREYELGIRWWMWACLQLLRFNYPVITSF